MENIAVLNLAVGLLVAAFSWQLSRLFGDAAHIRYWSLYWAAATFSSISAFALTQAFDLGNPQTRTLVRITIYLLLLPRPVLIWMAAGSLYWPGSPHVVRRLGWTAFALTAGWSAVYFGLPGPDHATRPAAGAYFLSAVAAAAFAFGLRRLGKFTGLQSAIGGALILADSVHLFLYGLTLAGWRIYPSWNSPVATAVSSVLGCLVVLGVGLLALREAADAQKNYQMMVERTPLGIHFYTEAPGGDLIFAGANPAADEILGISHREFVGNPILKAFPALVSTDIPSSYLEVMRSGRSFRREEVTYSDDRIAGAFDVVCFRLAPGSIAAMFSDITERKRSELALKESEARYRLITDNATDMISVHSPDGLYQFASPSARNLLGYTSEELCGMHAYDLLHPDDIAAIRASHHAVVRSAAAIAAYRIRHKNGSWIWVETNSRLATPDRGGESSIIAVTRDITERRKLEEQFQSAQRLESIGRLAGGIAHDFNNLLTVINGNAALIEADASATSRSRKLALSIRQAGDSAGSLVRHLLAFARRQRLEPATNSLNEIVIAARPVLERLIGEGISISLDLDPLSTQILADATQIHQVLHNLAVNARDAISGPGTITIRTRHIVLPSPAEPNTDLPPGEYVRLHFVDSGRGMPPEVRDRVFEPFFTTKPPGQSSGLGLSTVFGIVKQSNGHISVHSEPGRGTEFRIEFPILDRP